MLGNTDLTLKGVGMPEFGSRRKEVAVSMWEYLLPLVLGFEQGRM